MSPKPLLLLALTLCASLGVCRSEPGATPTATRELPAPAFVLSPTGRIAAGSPPPSGTRFAASATALPTGGPSVVPTTSVPQQRGHGKIVFVSRMGGQTDLWWIDSDGANLERLTNDNAAERGPRWSPQGDRIGYVSSGAAGQGQIRVLDVPSRQSHQLTEPSLSGAPSPTWSPDGKHIAFGAFVDRIPVLWLVHADTGERQELTRYRQMPLWSPDGRQLAAQFRLVEPDAGISSPATFYTIVGIDGEPLERAKGATYWQRHVSGMAWSHGGNLLLVTGDTDRAFLTSIAALDIVAVVDRTASVAVTHRMRCGSEDCDFFSPSWFPGDGEILFIAAVPLPPRAPYETPAPDEPEGRWWLYRAADDLSSLQVVLESALPMSEAALSPDGTHVVFVQGEYSDAELVVLDLGSGEITQLTANKAYDGQPVWQPQP